jgi:hypothetical protein
MATAPNRQRYMVPGTATDLRDVPGFEGLFAVTRDGRVWAYARSWIRGKGSQGEHEGHWMNPVLDATGYLRVRLSFGRRRQFPSVHRLVALAWIPNPDALPQVNHIDGDKLNNRDSNLEWCTAADNNRHAYAIGLHGPHPRRKLSDEGARTVRLRHAAGDSVTELAREFGLDRKTVYGVLKGRTYRVQP